MEFNFWSLLTVLILPHLPHVLDYSCFHLTSNTIAFSGFLAVTPGRQVGCKIRLPCVYLHVLCKACNWHLGRSINPGITARGKLEMNKVDRANLASFALLLWEKKQHRLHPSRMIYGAFKELSQDKKWRYEWESYDIIYACEDVIFQALQTLDISGCSKAVALSLPMTIPCFLQKSVILSRNSVWGTRSLADLGGPKHSKTLLVAHTKQKQVCSETRFWLVLICSYTDYLDLFLWIPFCCL